jgi:hypothetical protein
MTCRKRKRPHGSDRSRARFRPKADTTEGERWKQSPGRCGAALERSEIADVQRSLEPLRAAKVVGVRLLPLIGCLSAGAAPSAHRGGIVGSWVSQTAARHPRQRWRISLGLSQRGTSSGAVGPANALAMDDEQERRTTLLVPDRTGSLVRGGAGLTALSDDKRRRVRGQRVAWKKPRSTTGGMVAAACAGAALPHRELAAHRVRRAGRADDGAWDAAQLEGTK